MGAPRILVVDDDPGVRDLICATLRLEGLEVHAAEDGPGALARLRAEPVDLVLLDRMMPGMDGLAVLGEIRGDPELALLPVILVTAMGTPASAVEGLDSGADDYLAKPFDLDELAARVRAQLRGQRAWIDRLTATVARRRSVLASAAAAAGAATDVVAGAAALCDALVAEPDVQGVEIVEVAGGRARQLAAAGGEGRRLLQLASAREQLHLIDRGLPDGPTSVTLPDRVVHAAPVRDGASTLAVVVVTGAASAVDGLLALTIDTAALVRGVLAGALRTSRMRADARARIDAIVATSAFHPVFQPILDLTTGAVAGHEALSRFDAGLPPSEVFGEAIRLGATRELEHATLTEAVRQATTALPPACWLALNVTPTLLLTPRDLQVVLEPAAGRGIVLEISEMEPVADYPALRSAIAEIGAAVQISVDDAGAGFASLAHILALEARYVKLDKSWIRGIDTDPAKRALVAGLQSFAVETGASIIAEGIETDDQLDTVHRLGIAYGQGYLLGVPERAPAG
ncbi:MAG TPA: EAL domain-containing response regulator [Acidimicrobiales bacterium]|nr:EAL domain-containing response regulator [Acidimicrobiales bacterium]